MEKKKNNSNNNIEILKTNPGFVIILVSVIAFIVLILCGGVWMANIDFSSFFPSYSISSNELNAAVSNIDEDKLFEDNYYDSLNILSNTVAYGTTWLDLCSNSQTTINNQVYVKVCSNTYKSVDSIKSELGKYISNNLIDIFISDYYIDYNDSLYVIPVSTSKNEDYLSFESYKVIDKTINKIEYMVTSKYSDINCVDNCKYSYKEHKFVLEKENNKWLVKEFELPY